MFKRMLVPLSQVTLTWGISVKTDVAGTIVRLAEQTGGYDLIAMATHGRSGLLRLVMGSVTERILGATKLPLLLVRPHETEVKSEEMSAPRKAEGVGVEGQSWVGLF